jgi:phosphoadenosine phosphosulfate reductase
MAVSPLSPVDIAALADRFESASAEDLLTWASDRFADRIVLTCSWQRQSSVLVHMVATMQLPVRIVELDTGLLFPETYATRDALISRYGITVEKVDPLRSVTEQEADEGARLWERDPDRCCGLRKVEPLERSLVGMDAWITGIRRAQGKTRENARKIEFDPGRGIVKIQPLVDWDDERTQGYLYAHDIPYNALHDQGYPSIGCIPCTRAILPGEDPRAGRWAGTTKTECGLHQPASAA